jgi:ribonuclease Z
VPTRSRNVSSVAVKLSQRAEIWLLDCGEGTQHQILRSDLKISQIRRIFITHMHGDHIFGLMGLLASCGLAGNPEKIDIYGPPGLEDYLQACRRYSQTHFSYPIQVYTVKPGCVFADAEYEVYCDRLEHRVTAYGYRIQEKDKPGRFDAEKAKQLGIPSGPLYGKLKRGETVTLPDGQILNGADFCGAPQVGQKLAYCTDTVLCDSAIRLAYQVDVLIHESTYAHQDKAMAHDRLHSTATMAAQVAQSASAKKLFLTHFSPRYAPGNPIQIEDLLSEAQAIFQKTALAYDFFTYEIPR